MEPTTQTYLDCRRLFIESRGENLTNIEREMRALGHTKFHRRILYPRAASPGWIQKYNWPALLSVPPLVSGGLPQACCDTPSPSASTKSPEVSSQMHTDEHRCSEPSIPDPCPSVFICGRSSSASGDPSLTRDASDTSQSFPSWLTTVSSNMTWKWRHQQVILDQLERVTSGECKRLMIFLPPRHGKSELVTVRYTAWRMQQDPATNVILGSYNQRLADRFSRKIRKVISDAEQLRNAECGVRNEDQPPSASTRHVKTRDNVPIENPQSALRSPQSPMFPFASSRPANSVSEWETSAGGGFRAVGVGGGVTGFGAQLIVIDDPIKSRAEAESQTYRDNIYNWFNDDLYTRLEPDGAIVLIQTRWHEDDLAGRLLQEMQEGGEPWTVINLPALSEMRNAECGVRNKGEDLSASPVSSAPSLVSTPAEDLPAQPPEIPHSALRIPHSVDWRLEPNIALCPERFDEAALEKIKRKLGTYSFSALYQQRPTPASGGTFKREWFRRIIPYAPPGLKWKRGYDLAVSTRTGADYTATFKCAFDADGNLYIAGGFRQRLEFPDQRRLIIDLIQSEPDTEHGIELALHGQGLIQDLRRVPGVRGHLLRGVKVETDKLSRALSWAPLAEEGKVILVRNGPWIPDFLDEVCSFPFAAHDDQVDAVSLAVQMLKKPRYRSFGF